MSRSRRFVDYWHDGFRDGIDGKPAYWRNERAYDEGYTCGQQHREWNIMYYGRTHI